MIAVNGTTNINELALTAPIFDEAKKYIVFANDITTMDSKKIFSQYIESYLIVCEMDSISQKYNENSEALKKLQKLNVRK